MLYSILFALIPSLLLAKGEAPAAPGNTAFLLISAALVMIMVPGVGLFYGGMVRTKNVLNTIIISFAILSLVSIEWVLIGFSMVFSGDIAHVIGNFKWAGLQGIDLDTAAPIVPTLAYIAFEGMFAAITPTLINGSVVERVRFPAILLFTLLWSIAVYNPLAHWVWGPEGFLKDMGALDFAGGTVIHISSGVAALAACLYVGARKGVKPHTITSHNLTISVIGAILLWFGWFGFNPGSALAANEISANAFLTTHTSAACGAMGWMLGEWIHRKKPSALGILSGAITGLVVITPAAGFVSTASSIAIGFLGGIGCYLFSVAKVRIFHYDDALDVFTIHGVGGFLGALLTGVFASTQINPDGADGLLYGNASLLGVQLFSALICAVYAFFMTLILLRLVDWITPVRAGTLEESIGLDLAQHGESGYRF